MRPDRPPRLLAAVLLGLLFVTSAEAQCDLSTDPIRLSVEGFGTAYFQEFEADSDGDRVELAGGVCIVGEGASWTVVAEAATISGLRGERLIAEVAAPVLGYEGWRIVAERLWSDGETLELHEAAFSGHEVMGSARLLRLDLGSGSVHGSKVRVIGRNFRLEAEEAELVGDEVDLDAVSITTCNCPGSPFYLITGSEGHLELGAQRLDVGNGLLRIGGLRLPLARNVRLSGDLLDDLSLPVTLEYRPGSTGTGLGLVVPGIELAKGLSLHAGLLGLDSDNPLQAFALARYHSANLDFTIGRARGGPRADVQYLQPLAPTLSAEFAIRNRHEAESDYLHEGVLVLRADPSPFAVAHGVSLDLDGRLFAAVSVQHLAGAPVVSPRLGGVAGGQLVVPTGPGGTATIALEGRYTEYPAFAVGQYGVSLKTGWRYRREGWSLELDHDRLWTDSGSPFSTKLDRLTPQNKLSLGAAVAGPLSGDLEGSARLALGYDLLMLGSAVPNGLERLGASFGLEYPAGEWALAFRGQLELAGLLDPDPAAKRLAHVLVIMSAERGEWEVGTQARYDLRPGRQGLSLLEASAAVPFGFDSGTLTPFLAVDFAPLLLEQEVPRVSGHGALITWRSCCGTLKVGYRQQGDSFATTFGFALEY